MECGDRVWGADDGNEGGNVSELAVAVVEELGVGAGGRRGGFKCVGCMEGRMGVRGRNGGVDAGN